MVQLNIGQNMQALLIPQEKRDQEKKAAIPSLRYLKIHYLQMAAIFKLSFTACNNCGMIHNSIKKGLLNLCIILLNYGMVITI